MGSNKPPRLIFPSSSLIWQQDDCTRSYHSYFQPRQGHGVLHHVEVVSSHESFSGSQVFLRGEMTPSVTLHSTFSPSLSPPTLSHSRRMSSLPGPGPQGSQQQPQQGRCMELIQSIPLCTLLVTTICCLIQAGVFLLGWDIGRYAISTGDVIYAHQVTPRAWSTVVEQQHYLRAAGVYIPHTFQRGTAVIVVAAPRVVIE